MARRGTPVPSRGPERRRDGLLPSAPASERERRRRDPRDAERHRRDPDEPDPRERRDRAERDRYLEECDRGGIAVVDVEEVVGLALLRVALPLLLLRLLLDRLLLFHVAAAPLLVGGRRLLSGGGEGGGGALRDGRLHALRRVVGPLEIGRAHV